MLDLSESVPLGSRPPAAQAPAAPAWLTRRVTLLVAAAIALGSLFVSSELKTFPLGAHPDEIIVASLAQRARDTGRYSVNWSGFTGEFFDHPTYQFSPHSLLQMFLDNVVLGAENTREDILIARTTSALFAAGAVVLTAAAAFEIFGGSVALLASLLLAVNLIHAQDAIYARCDAMLGFLVALTLFLSARALRSGALGAACLAAAAAGLATACKYNAAPVALLPVLACFRVRRLPLLGALFLLAFLLATPELLRDPAPFFQGLRYEAGHYLKHGHMLYSAYDAHDSDLRYWSTYLLVLGFGALPAAAFACFVWRALRTRSREALLLLAFVVAGAIPVFFTRVRFERNLETILPALMIGAAAGAAGLWQRLSGKLQAALALLLLAQPLFVLRDFSVQVHAGYPRAPVQANWSNVGAHDPPTTVKSDERSFAVVYFRNPWAEAGLERFRKLIGEHIELWSESAWASRGYPFSTVDTYHPATTIIFMQRR